MVADFDKKENREFFNDKLLFKTIGILFLIGIFGLILADFKIYQRKQNLIARITAYQKQIEDIQKSSQTLKAEIANSENVDYLEKIGYEQFNVTKPGETEYMFIESQSKTEPTSPPQNFWNIKSWLGWLGQSWSWIKSKF